MLKLRSSLNRDLLKKVLFKGTFIAFLGVLFLFLAGFFFPLALLKTWGLPIVLAGFTLIASGMLPYKKLNKLATSPHEIYCNESDLTFIKSGAPLFRLNIERIAALSFVETKETYGIGIQLKRPPGACITILNAHRLFATFASDVKGKVPDSDLFLPYFNHLSFKELQEFIEEIKQDLPE